jgi:hypothetical protein
MRFTILLLIFVFAMLSPIQGATLTFLNTTDGGSTFLYSGSVQNNQQVNSGDYFVIFDFAGLVSGSGPSSDWVFNIQNDVAGHPDNPSVTDATFTYAGSSIIGQPGQTPLGIFTLKTTATGQQQGSYVFETTRSDGGNAGSSIDQSAITTVAAGASAVPEPSAILLVGGGLLAACLRRQWKVS